MFTIQKKEKETGVCFMFSNSNVHVMVSYNSLKVSQKAKNVQPSSENVLLSAGVRGEQGYRIT